MELDSAEETIPLLEHSRRTGGSSGVVYDSILRSGRSSIFSKRKSNWSEDIQQNLNVKPGNLLGCSNENTSVEKVTYSWMNLNVFTASENRRKQLGWKRPGNLAKNRESLVGEPRRILRNAYGVACPGEFLAIMGPSGAGKTTLLNTLTFQPGFENVEGSRNVNGCPVKGKNFLSRLSAYVEQENLFLGTLTVREHLIFQALLRIDGSLSYRQKIRRVDDVIAELGLDKCRDTMIGCPGRTKGISGGESKRLSFASEVLTNPSIMFCDEPTSGLDSFMAQNVISVLKSMAIRGKTVICTIHQPSSEMFSLFDKILLLAEGRTAFLGEPTEAVSFFTELGAAPPAHYNPADFFMQLLAVLPRREEASKQTANMICDFFDQSRYGLEINTKIECQVQNQLFNENISRHPTQAKEQFAYTASWWCQFGALLWRSWINIIKEPILVKVRLFQTVVLSFIVGLIYHQQKLNEDGVMNINGVLFTFLTNMTFQNVFAVISTFCMELPIFVKEHSNRLYRVDVYFLTKSLAEIPMFLAVPIIFTSITYFWIRLNPELYHFVMTVLIMILVTNVATSFGYFISCISKNIVMALSLGPPVIIPFLLFGGFLLNSGSVPGYLKWLSYFSWFKYGNEALLVNQWSDISTIECNKSNVTCPRTGEIVLKMYNFQKDNFWWDISSLFALILIFRVFAFVALLLKTIHRDSR